MNRNKETARRKRTPQVRVRLPKFKSEAEEAAWWDAHPEIVTKALAHAYGGKARKRPPTKTVTIRLPVEDVARAQRVAARKGLGYQTIVKTLLHEALLQEDQP